MFVSSKNGRDIVKRKNKFVPRLFLSALVVVLVAVFSFFIVRLFTFSVKNKTSSTYIYKKWAENDYAAVYEACTQKLLKQPYNLACAVILHSLVFVRKTVVADNLLNLTMFHNS